MQRAWLLGFLLGGPVISLARGTGPPLLLPAFGLNPAGQLRGAKRI